MVAKCEEGILVEVKNILEEEIEYKERYPVAHKSRAEKYADLIRKGVEFPPIQVFGKRFEGDTYQVFDGHARVLAHRLLGLEDIESEITLVHRRGLPISCKE